MPTTSAYPDPAIVLQQASTKPTTTTRQAVDRTDALYAAVHKALCQLAFDLQALSNTQETTGKDTTSDTKKSFTKESK